MRSHYRYQTEVTREPDIESERAARNAERLAHIRLHSRVDEQGHHDGGHIAAHFDHDGELQGEYDFAPQAGADLIAHLIHHAHIELPPDLAEHLKLYTDESAGEEES